MRRFLSTNDTGNCFVALPGAVRNNKVGVYGFTKSSGLWPGFLQKLGQKTRLEVPAKLATITDAQCLVASFARQTRSYPNFTVSIVLAEDKIVSGDFLEGALNNVKGRYLNLILVDDEGIAQRLNAYLFNKDTTPQFSLPVSSTSGPVATAQLLLAVVTDRELRSAAIYDPMPVSEFLYDLEQEIIEQGLEVDLAIAAFTVN